MKLELLEQKIHPITMYEDFSAPEAAEYREKVMGLGRLRIHGRAIHVPRLHISTRQLFSNLFESDDLGIFSSVQTAFNDVLQADVRTLVSDHESPFEDNFLHIACYKGSVSKIPHAYEAFVSPDDDLFTTEVDKKVKNPNYNRLGKLAGHYVELDLTDLSHHPRDAVYLEDAHETLEGIYDIGQIQTPLWFYSKKSQALQRAKAANRS